MNGNVHPLVLDNVSVLFGEHAALDGVNLSFRRGAVTAVIGASGSGKSLVLKSAAGLIFPEKGRVYFEGQDIAAMNETDYRQMQARTGFHFQDAALWANKSLKENLTFPLLAANPDLPDELLDRLVEEAFEAVGLDVDKNIRPAAISMGQRKMISFLRAVVSRPEILFLDDPASFLDGVSIRRLIGQVKKARQDGVTIVMADHNLSLDEELAEYVAVLDRGHLVVYGSCRDVLNSPDREVRSVLEQLK